VHTVKMISIALGGLLGIVLSSCAPSGSATRDHQQVLDPVMGDWQGHRVARKGEVLPITVQAIALGNAQYRFVARELSIKSGAVVQTYDATLDGKRLHFPANPEWKAVCESGTIDCRNRADESPVWSLTRSVRLSPSLGARPPNGAIWLFDGTSLDAWQRRDPAQRSTPVGWAITGGVMEVVPGTGDILTKRPFTDFQMHLEFRTPFMPEASGQGRGNSGVYLQGRYEVQVLDSYGLKGEDNECGGIYKVAAPRENMCAPPGQWQSYDITFHAPRFDGSGKKITDALLTVLHNGVIIHENLAVPGPTGGALDENVQQPGGILLQDHGNQVQYRNIWLVELSD